MSARASKQRRRKLVLHSSDYESDEEDNFEDVRAELKATSFNLVWICLLLLFQIDTLLLFNIFMFVDI